MKTLLLLGLGAGAAYYVLYGDNEVVRAPSRAPSRHKLDRSKWPKKERDYYKREVHKLCDKDPEGFAICSRDFEEGIDVRVRRAA